MRPTGPCGTGVALRRLDMNETSISSAAGKVWLGSRRSVACPRCGDSDTHRSRTRGLLAWLLSRLTGTRTFRCEACTRQFLAWR